jgi:hypothetical protein
LSASPGDVLVCKDIEMVTDGWDGHSTILFINDGGRLREVLRARSGFELSSPPAPTPPIVEVVPSLSPDGLRLSLTENPQATCAKARSSLAAVVRFGWPKTISDRYQHWLESICMSRGIYEWARANHRFAKRFDPADP